MLTFFLMEALIEKTSDYLLTCDDLKNALNHFVKDD